MKTVQKSVLIWYSAQNMFDLVTAIDTYPQFLPWCDKASIRSQSPDKSSMVADVGMNISGFKKAFVTQNKHNHKENGVLCIDMQLLEGPFSKLEGHWHFTPVGDENQRACRTELHLQYGFDNPILATIVGPVFDKIAASMVDAFVQRATQIYDKNPML